jgi:hypothetical protein
MLAAMDAPAHANPAPALAPPPDQDAEPSGFVVLLGDRDRIHFLDWGGPADATGASPSGAKAKVLLSTADATVDLDAGRVDLPGPLRRAMDLGATGCRRSDGGIRRGDAGGGPVAVADSAGRPAMSAFEPGPPARRRAVV